jgi:hypothetical protein
MGPVRGKAKVNCCKWEGPPSRATAMPAGPSGTRSAARSHSNSKSKVQARQNLLSSHSNSKSKVRVCLNLWLAWSAAQPHPSLNHNTSPFSPDLQHISILTWIATHPYFWWSWLFPIFLIILLTTTREKQLQCSRRAQPEGAAGGRSHCSAGAARGLLRVSEVEIFVTCCHYPKSDNLHAHRWLQQIGKIKSIRENKGK